MAKEVQGQVTSGQRDSKWKVGILGATGYTGITLLSLLLSHKDVEVSLVTSNTHRGKSISYIFPFLKGIYENILAPTDILPEGEWDVIFLCLPHGSSMEGAKRLFDGKRIIIDLSADFRFEEVTTYERFYTTHTAKELISQAIYGLPEIYRERIRKSKLIANPGCYPTSVLLALYPLLREGLIESEIFIDSKSGVSGAGREAKVQNLFSEVSEGFRAYGVGTHRHEPEIRKEVEKFQSLPITFVPHLLPINRGILTTIYTRIKKGFNSEDAIALYKKVYEKEPFVRVLEKETFPDTRNVRASNYCDIGLKVLEDGRAIIISAIDNLVKGASGQAIQNMNIALGIDEKEGLSSIPIYP